MENNRQSWWLGRLFFCVFAVLIADFICHTAKNCSDADAIINFCKLKTHGMMGMSAATKNLFGTIPGTQNPCPR